MPAPAVTVLAIIGGVGAALAFKFFVYDPHIAPQVELWKEEWLAKRRARQQQRQQQQQHGPIPIPMRRRRNSDSDSSDDDDNDDESRSRGRTGSGWGDNVSSTGISGNRNSNMGMSEMRNRQGTSNVLGEDTMDDLVAREVSEWRNQVQRSRPSGSGSGSGSGFGSGYIVRQRSNRGGNALDESNKPILYKPLPIQPTHVLIDSSVPTTPSTTVPSRPPSPPPQVSPWQTTNIISTPIIQSTFNSNGNGNNGSSTPPNLSSQSQSVPLPAVASPSRASVSAKALGRTSSNPFTPTSPSHYPATAYMTPESPSRQFRELQPEMSQIDNNSGRRGPLISGEPAPAPVSIRSPEPYLLQSQSTPTSPIPSLSQSYPQETDHEIGVELVSPPSSGSSGTSSPFMTFSPFMAPQELASISQITSQSQHQHQSQQLRSQPQQQQQQQQQQETREVISPFQSWSNVTSPVITSPLALAPVSVPTPADYSSRTLSPSSITTPTISMSNYQSFPTSPVLSVSGFERDSDSDSEEGNEFELNSDLSSPINVTNIQLRSPSPVSPISPFTFTRNPREDEELSSLSSPSPINFYRSPNLNASGSGSGSGNGNSNVNASGLNVEDRNILSPKSPHSDISDFDFDVLSDEGSGNGSSDESWTGIHSDSSRSQGN